MLHLEEFPDIFPSHSISSLRLLRFDFSNIENLPSSIENLRKLCSLSLTFCTKLKCLPESICSLQHLTALDLGICGIEKLPEDFGELECLEWLNLSNTKIKHFPDSICKLKNLKTLFLEGCEDSQLPEDFGQFESLNKLSLRSSKIRDIPSSILKLKHIQELDLSKCSKLKQLPENLGDLECLVKLNLTHAPISHLPDSISSLEGLEIIGYEGGIDPDALISQEQQRITRVPKRENTNIEATTSDTVVNESQPMDLNEQMVDQASMTCHAGAKRSYNLRNMLKFISPISLSTFLLYLFSSFLHVG
ncbi:putative leucine-rich repeat domain superfamily [Helianthus anomalus]